jgi:adenine-specific DNA-methyltransferase
MAKQKKAATQVTSIKHKEKRANIPTEELRDFVAEDEKTPKTLLYPRDPSLDPQLVWKGKDEQDRQDLAVPVVPIYIQEKIQPQAIIEGLRTHAAAADDRVAEEMAAYQTKLFADFNGIEGDFERKIDFYSHDSASQPHWSNRMILGDSLLVMTSLAEKEGLKGKVQCIYLDPPYGIRFGSNWQVSTRKRDVKDGRAEDTTRQPEQIRAFRDTWKLGIHSYLAYLRDRLVVVRELLTETGSIFVQIGIDNVHLVRSVMDEIFGAENFVSLITFRTTANLVGNFIGRNSDYILWFGRNAEKLKYRQLYVERGMEDDIGGRYSRVHLSDGTRKVMTGEERLDPSQLPSGSEIYRHDNLTSQGPTPSGTFWFTFCGEKYHSGHSRHWTTGKEGLERLCYANRLAAPSPNSLAYVRFMKDYKVGEYTNVWTDTQTGAFTDDKVYIVQTRTYLKIA